MGSYDFNTAKEEYRRFCDQGEHDIQIFALPWYLDTVCDSPDDWQVIIYKENNRIIGAFPFQYKKNKRGMWTISNPWQAQRLGIWIDYGNREGNSKRENLENTITKFIIQNLPYFDLFNISFDSRYTNWREFYNNGFSQETRYSYVVFHSQNSDDYISTVSKHRRKGIKLAQELFQIKQTSQVSDIDDYFEFFINSYYQRGRKISYSEEQIKKLLRSVLQNGQGKIYFANDFDGNICAECIVFSDLRRRYAMYGTFNPDKSNSGRELLTYKAIEDTIQSGKDYDFEGSMISGVAQYNREFNPQLEPYYLISKYSSRMKLYLNFRENINIFKNWILHRKG